MTDAVLPGAERLRAVRVMLTDLDDTVTRRGCLGAETFAALHELAAAGVPVIPVTGGCAGWCDHIVRAWPVAAVIGENGAFSFRLDAKARLVRRFWQPLDAVRADQRRLLAISEEALAAIPGARLAGDQDYRLADVAVDHAQDVGPLATEDVGDLLAAFHGAGAQAQASSIHVNAWFGEYDKAVMAERLLAEDFGVPAAEQADRVLFLGDAPNDEPMFRRYPLSVGVANIRPRLSAITHPPGWITAASHGDGFCELAAHLLAARGD